jgi:hypothetical protein
MPAALRLARFPLTPAARWWPWADSHRRDKFWPRVGPFAIFTKSLYIPGAFLFPTLVVRVGWTSSVQSTAFEFALECTEMPTRARSLDRE